MGWGHELGSREQEGWQQAGSKEAALLTPAMLKLLAHSSMWSRRKINLMLQNH